MGMGHVGNIHFKYCRLDDGFIYCGEDKHSIYLTLIMQANFFSLPTSRYNFMYLSANIEMKPEIPFMASLFSISILQTNSLRRNVSK